jgi:hypothetical protein
MLTRLRFGLVLHQGDRATFRHLGKNHQVQRLRLKAGCTSMSFGQPSNSERRTVAIKSGTHLRCTELVAITGYVLIV